jgi:hypothetical protein
MQSFALLDGMCMGAFVLKFIYRQEIKGHCHWKAT